MSNGEGSDFDVARAELFEALSHPNRIKILKALSGEALGFSELRRAVGMESSGLLSFHLQKLTHLVKTTPEGTYALTDDGKEALRMAETIRDNGPSSESKKFTRHLSLERVVIVALLIGVIAIGAVAVYQQQQIGSLNHSVSSEQAGSVLINSARYWHLSVPLQSVNLPETFQLNGVTFNLTSPASGGIGFTVYANLLRNGTLHLQQPTGTPITIHASLYPDILMQFADGHKESYNFSSTTNVHGVFQINFQPTVNPWFSYHSDPRAGVFLNSTTNILTLYVSMGT